WKDDILKEAKETLQHLQDENQNHPDLADRASSETDRAIELRARDRQRKLIAKIDEALARIEDGTYGYCEETGEPIALKRLEARPWPLNSCPSSLTNGSSPRLGSTTLRLRMKASPGPPGRAQWLSGMCRRSRGCEPKAGFPVWLASKTRWSSGR